MKMRSQKHFKKLIKLGKIITVRFFTVARKKDGAFVAMAESKQEANAMIAKAKLSKKASLYIAGSYTQKYARHYESQVR